MIDRVGRLRRFLLSRAECQRLNSADRDSFVKVRRTLAPIVARIFGLPEASVYNAPVFDIWAQHVFQEDLNLMQVVMTLVDEVENPLTQRLVRDLFIAKTSFFRHHAQYQAFLHSFRELFSDRGQRGDCSPVRIWVPGCSDGNEAYTIAMILRQQGYTEQGAPIEILGTDISAENIAAAKSGRYSRLDDREEQMMVTGTVDLTQEHRHYFNADPRSLFYQVKPEIMGMVTFMLDNLFYSRVRGEFDIISCHFVLDHCSRETREMAPRFLSSKLKHKGFIISNNRELFSAIEGLQMVEPEPNKVGYSAFRML